MSYTITVYSVPATRLILLTEPESQRVVDEIFEFNGELWSEREDEIRADAEAGLTDPTEKTIGDALRDIVRGVCSDDLSQAYGFYGMAVEGICAFFGTVVRVTNGCTGALVAYRS